MDDTIKTWVVSGLEGTEPPKNKLAGTTGGIKNDGTKVLSMVIFRALAYQKHSEKAPFYTILEHLVWPADKIQFNQKSCKTLTVQIGRKNNTFLVVKKLHGPFLDILDIK